MKDSDDDFHIEILSKLNEKHGVKQESFVRAGNYYIFRELVRLGNIVAVEQILRTHPSPISMLESLDHQAINFACLSADIRMLNTLLNAITVPEKQKQCIGYALDITIKMGNQQLQDQIIAAYPQQKIIEFPYEIVRFEPNEVAQAAPTITTITEDTTAEVATAIVDNTAETTGPEIGLWEAIGNLVDEYGGIDRRNEPAEESPQGFWQDFIKASGEVVREYGGLEK